MATDGSLINFELKKKKVHPVTLPAERGRVMQWQMENMCLILISNVTSATSITSSRSQCGRAGDSLHSNGHSAAVSHEVLHVRDEHHLVSWVRNIYL